MRKLKCSFPDVGLNMRSATSSDGSSVVLKIVDDEPDELTILEYLNDVKSVANHTIELHGVVNVTIAKVIALRWRTSLCDYLDSRMVHESTTTFPEQSLEGVAFFHVHRIAHLDLNPENVVIDPSTHPPRLLSFRL